VEIFLNCHQLEGFHFSIEGVCNKKWQAITLGSDKYDWQEYLASVHDGGNTERK
jgi:hypothetical protein